MEFALRFRDREIVDTGEAFLHQSIDGKLPIFIPVRTKPVFAIVMPFAGKPHSDPIIRECPQLLNQAVFKLLGPFARKKCDYLGAAADKLRSVSPETVRRIDECAPFRIAGIPTVFGASYFLLGSLTSKGWQRWTYLSHVKFLILHFD
jgi:hypothetical protein